MKKRSYLFENGKWDSSLDGSLNSPSTLVVCFGSSNTHPIEIALEDIYNNFQDSIIMGCSTSGEIHNDLLYDQTLVVMVMQFEKTSLKLHTQLISDSSDSFNIGRNLAKDLQNESLKAIFLLSDGLNINGSQLTKGIVETINGVTVTGGLAGDGANFKSTWVLANTKPQSQYITAVGFYGEDIHIAYGSQGGWKKFGIDRMVTQANANILYKLDNQPALEVYKKYLGDNAKDLPASGLLYPLMIKEKGYSEAKVRTILAIDEQEQSITFAGDIPNGSEVMFMKATFNELVEGASQAAAQLEKFNYDNQEGALIAISCVGRKLVLGSKTEDELEAVMEYFSDNVEQIGYYSYGEISPLNDGRCDLHNQTMTLTLIWEE